MDTPGRAKAWYTTESTTGRVTTRVPRSTMGAALGIFRTLQTSRRSLCVSRSDWLDLFPYRYICHARNPIVIAIPNTVTIIHPKHNYNISMRQPLRYQILLYTLCGDRCAQFLVGCTQFHSSLIRRTCIVFVEFHLSFIQMLFASPYYVQYLCSRSSFCYCFVCYGILFVILLCKLCLCVHSFVKLW